MAENNGIDKPGNAYEAAPDKRVERQALLDRGMELSEEKAQLLSEKPVNREAIAEIDVQLQAAEDKFVDLMKDEYGRLATPAQLRERFQNKINRRARGSIRKGDEDGVNVETTVNIFEGTPVVIDATAAPLDPAVERAFEKEDIKSKTTESLKDLETNIEEYIGKNRALILIAQKFRESEPKLLASSLISGEQREHAITVALYAYPNLAHDYIQGLRKGGAHAAKANEILARLSKNLEPHISNLIEKEELQAETLNDDITKHAANGLSKVVEEFKRHPLAALVGAGMLTAAVAALWGTGGETTKKWLTRGAVGTGLVGGAAIIGNMLFRSFSDDGRDLWDTFGKKPSDLTSNNDVMDRISRQFPGLKVANDQAARDLERMLNSDCGDVYKVFMDAFSLGKTEINPQTLATMGTGLDDVKRSEAQSMNGKASYLALEEYFLLLAQKNGKQGKTRRESVEQGLQLFHEKFVNKADRPNLNSAILMTINKKDARAAAGVLGLDYDGAVAEGAALDAAETTRQNRIIEDLKKKGLDTWTEDGVQKPVHVEVISGRPDGEQYVRINGFTWEYKYDAAQELHTFKTMHQGKELEVHVGKTVNDRIGEITEKVVQQRVNDFYATTPMLSGADTLTYDVDAKEWVAKKEITSPALSYLGLSERKRHVAIVFKPGMEAPSVRIQESEDREGTTSIGNIESMVSNERVKEKVVKDLRTVTGQLPVQIVKFSQTADADGKGEVMIKWGQGSYDGKLVYKNQEIVEVVLVATGQEIPVELKVEWENLADRDATQLVENNTDAQHVFTSLTAAFAGKKDYPDFPTSLNGLKDAWDFIANLDVQDEDKKWLEAVHFQQAALHAEVKRAIIQEYSTNFAAGGTNAMFNETARNTHLQNEVVAKVLEPRLGKLKQMAREIAGSGSTPGKLEEIQEERIEELRNKNMTPEYQAWIQQFKGVMDGEVRGIDLDTVGVEGLETSRMIHDAILLTIFEYTYPMNSDTAVYNNADAVAWRTNFEQSFPVAISIAIQNQEGNWWIDQRYNTMAFKKALEAEGVKPWKDMDLSGITGSLSPSLNIPFYQPEYRGIEGEKSGPVNIDKVPEALESESPVDYSRRMADYLRGSSITLYSEIGDIEKSLRDDEFDNFINWRLERVVEEFNEFNRTAIDPKVSATAQHPQLNKDIQEFSEKMVIRLKQETRDLKKYQLYLENPEGLFSYLTPAPEADVDDWRKAERDMLRGVIREDSGNVSDWQDASVEVLDWMDAEYQNETLMGLGVNWIRQDIMEIWMQKHNYGRVAKSQPDNNLVKINYNPQDIEDYRRFFTDVSEDQLSQMKWSANDWRSLFKRNNEAEWKTARGRLSAIPDFEEWIALGKPPRSEVRSLDWETHEQLQDYRNMRAEVDKFMEDFDNDIDVSEWTRLDGRWPAYFREHAKSRIETDILPKAKDITDLRKGLGEFKKALHVEAAFYDRLINTKIEANDGTEFKSLAVPVLMGVGIAGGSVAGALAFSPVLGGLGGAAGGAALGAIVGNLLEYSSLPNPGFDYGELVHSKIRASIDDVFSNNFMKAGPPAELPEAGTFDVDTYAQKLDAELEKIIKDAIAKDAEELDFGPLTIRSNGSTIDGVQVSP